jgi:hypothetical protein
MNKKMPLVTSATFPSYNVPDAEKETVEYGLKVGQAIQYEWFNREGSNCRYYDQQVNFNNLRLYARGEQSIGKYKKGMEINGDLSQLNLNWQPPAVVPKFVDIIVNGMSDRMFTPRAFAEDAMSAEIRNSYQESLEKDMLAKNILMQTKENLGVDGFTTPPDQLPQSDQELQLHMQMEYKPSIEIAEELAISTVFEMNDFHEKKNIFNYDVTTLGIGIIKHNYSYNEGIKIENVDPAETIYSYTEKPDFSDCFYWGEVKKIPITELKKINPNLTTADIEEISNLSTLWAGEYNNYTPINDSVYDNSVVNVLFFNYKTDKSFIYKKKILDNGGERAIRRDESFNPEGESEFFERLEKRLDVWYDGAMVLGSNVMLKWELMKNMVRPESEFQRTVPAYIATSPRMYKGNIDSTVRRMIKYADLIAMTDLKIQQIQQKMVPDGIFLDLDGVNEVDLGNGGTYDAQAAIDMYFATGSVVGRSYTGEGEFNNARVPVQELSNSSGQSKLVTLTRQYDHWLNMLRDVTGINESRDASTPDPNALVGVQKLAALNSNTATRHILQSGLYMTQKLAEAVSLRVSDILEYSEDREEFANQIGKYNVGILDKIKNLYLSSFGIFIDVSPDEEEKQLIEQNIQQALSKNSIELEDAIDIRNCKNLKLGNELLKLKRRQKIERDEKRKMAEIKAQSDANMQAQQAAAQSKMQTEQAVIQGKMALVQAQSEADIRKMNFEVEAKKVLMEQEFNYNMQIKGVEAQNITNRDMQKEDRKDQRIDKQSTQQSTMIQQRKDNTPPVNFESNEDTLDGFGLESFG